ncbi:hypothetical protein D3C73_1090390 [compost metagenome]
MLASYKLNEFKGSVAIFAIWINANESAHASDGNWIIDTFREWKWSHIEFHIGFAGSDIRLKHIHGPFSVNQHGDITAFELLDPVRAFGLHLFIAHVGLILVIDTILKIEPFGYGIKIIVKNSCAFLKSAQRGNKPVRIITAPLLVCTFAFRQGLGQLGIFVPGHLLGIIDAFFIKNSFVVEQGILRGTVRQSVIFTVRQHLRNILKAWPVCANVQICFLDLIR